MLPFHYAFKVSSIAAARQFYVEVLQCPEGRSTADWIDFNFFGHQLSAHVSADIPVPDYCGKVDGIAVPIPHFGSLLTAAQFDAVAQRLEAADISFIVKPCTRYEGEHGEQRTLFVQDNCGNSIEFKSFKDLSELF